jgi:ParB-like chromosome segregation protein Spo0J
METDHDFNKVAMLAEMFLKEGFDVTKPALVGYPIDGKIQLLSGTHRHRAALKIGMKLPVTLFIRSDVERVWGTELWESLIEDIAVQDLMEVEVTEGFKIPPYEPARL